MRILITGANGQLGRDLQQVLRAHELRPLSRHELDVTGAGATSAAIGAFRPHVVVHAAALTNTATCEREPDLATEVNALGAGNVARACAAAGASIVYLSTNEVFDGTKRRPYSESEEPRPLNAYGRSKLQGERHVLEALAAHYIVRTSWLYGHGGDNFVAKVLRWAQGGHLTGVTDEIATPTWTRDLAAAIARLIETDSYGVYHLSNAGEASRYDWAKEIVHLAHLENVAVQPITTEQFRSSLPAEAIAPEKPPYSVLANTAAASFGSTMRSWQDALAEYVSEQR